MSMRKGLLLFLLLEIASGGVFADPPNQVQLGVKPNRCIALHQGQFCYQSLTFSWWTALPHRHCLYLESEPEPMACWEARKLSRYQYEFKSTEDQWFILRDETEQRVLARIKVDVAWVYKRSKKVSTGWRLF